MNRRTFVRSALGSGVAAGLPLGALAASPDQTSKMRPPNPFWTPGVVRKLTPAVSFQSARQRIVAEEVDVQANPQPPAPVPVDRTPVFVYHDQAKATFVDSGDIPLTIASGDVNVTIRVMRFRPSIDDQKIFRQVQNGSLRVDLQQTKAAADVGLPLAWSVIAGLLPGSNGALPNLSNLSFDPGTSWQQLNQILLPQGQGSWTWNFFLQKKKSIWQNILETVDSSVKGGTPQAFFAVLGLPAIAVTALEDVDKLVSYLTAKEEETYLFKSSDTPVAATKAGGDALGPGTVHLVSGVYMIVPTDHAKYVQTSGYTITNEGLYVPTGTDSLRQYDAAQNAIPQMTYLTVNVQVTAKAPAA